MEFWIIAGINGAGKTTAAKSDRVKSLMSNVPVLNIDDLTLSYLKGLGYDSFDSAPKDVLKEQFLQAARDVERKVSEAIDQEKSIGIETVLSTYKYKDLLEKAQYNGMQCTLVYVGLSSIDLAAERIKTRVARGGHDVPREKLQGRWGRSLENLTWFARRVDRLIVIDNSRLKDSNNLIAYGESGKITIISPDRLPLVTTALHNAMGDDDVLNTLEG